MATVKSGMKRLWVPLGVILGVGIALSWYYFGWVASRRDYFRKRNFRQLATLSSQIQQKIDNFDNIMDHSWDSIKDRGPEERANYFINVGSDLEYQKVGDLPRDVQHMTPNDPPSLAIERDEGQCFLFFALAPSAEPETHSDSGRWRKPKVSGRSRKAKPKEAPQNPSDRVLYTRSSVDKLISPLAFPLRATFETILIARSDGTVIFQQSSANGVLNIGGLEKARAEGKVDVRTLDNAAISTEVKLAGANYTLYSQPIRLSYPSVPGKVELPDAEPAAQSRPPEDKKGHGTKTAGKASEGSEPTETTKAAEAGTNGVEEWIVCGLVQSDRFNRESLAISSTAVLVFVVALVFIFFLSPFIKLSLLRSRERLRARDGVLLATSTFLGTALLSFVALDAYYYGFQFHHEIDAQLMSVAQSMQKNLNDEENAIWQQLNAFDELGNPLLAEDLKAIQTRRETGEPKAPKNKHDCHQQPIDGQELYVCERTNILGGQGLDYPYLSLVLWDDDEGMQRIKWTFQKQVTPFLRESDQPYFEGIEKEASWWERDHARKDMQKTRGVDPVRGIDSIYSVNSGKNIAIYWKLEEPDSRRKLTGKPSEHSQLSVASLVTRPVSLIGPVLPADCQFAVVNKDGLVLFHSDPTKNGIENFFAESDNDETLRSRVSEGASDLLPVYYTGRRQCLYVCPLQHNVPEKKDPVTLKGHSDWSMAVFEDMQPSETMNAKALINSSMLFGLYAVTLVIAWVLIQACWRGYPSKWFWPAEQRVGVYRLVALLNGFIAGVFLICILRAGSGTVKLAGFLIPAFTLALTFLFVNYRGGEGAGREAPSVEDQNVTGQKASASGSFALAWHHVLAFLNHSERPHWEASHAWARVSFLIVVAVLPSYAFFRVSFESERMLLINHGRKILSDSLHERQERVRSDYQSIDLSDENEGKVLDGNKNDDGGTKYWLALGNPGEQAPAPGRIGWQDWGAWFGLAALVAVVLLFVRLGEKIFLPGLHQVIIEDPEEQGFSDTVAEFKRRVSGANREACQQMAGFFHDECSPTPELRAIAKQFVSQMSDTARITQEEISLRIQHQAKAYYQTLWGTLSKNEKLVLAQLAREGLLNPKNQVLVAQLMERGLIVRNPYFRLMNRSFTRFVIAALPPHTMEGWETEGVRLPWNTLRFVLLAAVASLGIFLYVTQQSLFESVAAYAAAIAAAVPTLIQFIGVFQRAPAVGTHAG